MDTEDRPRTFGVVFAPSFRDRLASIAAAEHRSTSDLIRELIGIGLKAREVPERESVA